MTDTPINGRMSRRLLAVASMVTPGSRVADIGTDHAYVPVYLVENHIAPSVIAMDVRKGPLARAAESVNEAGLSGQIQLRLSDGLEKLVPGEADTAVIAGMGGMLICHILTAHPETTASVRELVLEPQSETDKVRRLITSELGFVITDEQMICEDGKYYPVIRAGQGIVDTKPLSEMELRFGPVLLAKKDPVLLQYLRQRIRVNEAVADRLQSAGSEHALQRLQEIKEERRLLAAAYDSYEM